VRVREPVSTVLEMTEIQTRLIAESGPAVLFENVTMEDGAHSEFPVLVNLFGTVKRVAMGVTMSGIERSDGSALREVGEVLATLRQPEPPRSFGEAMELLPLAKVRDVDAPEDGWRAPLPANRPSWRRHRSLAPARPDLLAGRTRSSHHLAARGDEGTRKRARRQFSNLAFTACK